MVNFGNLGDVFGDLQEQLDDFIEETVVPVSVTDWKVDDRFYHANSVEPDSVTRLNIRRLPNGGNVRIFGWGNDLPTITIRLNGVVMAMTPKHHAERKQWFYQGDLSADELTQVMT